MEVCLELLCHVYPQTWVGTIQIRIQNGSSEFY